MPYSRQSAPALILTVSVILSTFNSIILFHDLSDITVLAIKRMRLEGQLILHSVSCDTCPCHLTEHKGSISQLI